MWLNCFGEGKLQWFLRCFQVVDERHEVMLFSVTQQVDHILGEYRLLYKTHHQAYLLRGKVAPTNHLI